MEAGIKVEGGRQLRKALADLDPKLDDLKDAHQRVSKIVEQHAKGNAPRRTGKLANSIRGNRAKTRATVKAGGARVRYAGVIEWGWPKRHIPAQHYLVNAAHDTEPTWQRIYLEDVNDLLDKVAASTPRT
jgi:phage gpG-like protein